MKEFWLHYIFECKFEKELRETGELHVSIAHDLDVF